MNDHAISPATLSAETPTERPLPYFPVSLRKLIVLWICSFGLYELYWQFCHWLYIRDYEKSRISPGARAVFGFIFLYPLLRRIRRSVDSRGSRGTFHPGLLFMGWFIFTLAGVLPRPLFLLAFASVLFLLPAQKAANALNVQADPDHDPNDTFTMWNKIFIVVGGLAVVLAIVGSFLGVK